LKQVDKIETDGLSEKNYKKLMKHLLEEERLTLLNEDLKGRFQALINKNEELTNQTLSLK